MIPTDVPVSDIQDDEKTPGRRRADQYLADRLMSFQERDLKFRRLRFWLFWLALIMGPTLYWLTVYWLIGPQGVKGEYAALVRLEGEIGADATISAAKFNPAITEAFKDDKAKGIILVVNSPGGSPVQSSLVHDRILALKRQYPGRKIIAVAEDMMTSGAYFIAAAADQIYVNRSSMVGSIGVVMNGFGVDLPRLAQQYKLPIERRVYTAGEHKVRMDPFTPVTREDFSKVKGMLEQVHAHFIDAVQSGRGGRLHGDLNELFSGDYWTGEQAVTLGLADGLSDVSTVLRTQFAAEQVKDYTPPSGFFDRLQRSYGVLSEIMTWLTAGESGMTLR